MSFNLNRAPPIALKDVYLQPMSPLQIVTSLLIFFSGMFYRPVFVHENILFQNQTARAVVGKVRSVPHLGTSGLYVAPPLCAMKMTKHCL